jgi:histidyl-tRNA synthetase
MARTRPLSPKGFPDVCGDAATARANAAAALQRTWYTQGFDALDTPALETVEALGAFLPDTDRPKGGVFAFETEDDGWLALRYDLTAPLARFYAANMATLPRPFKRSAIGPVWRNDKPGTGRLRQFIQCDVDVVGTSNPEADAEILEAICDGLEALGLLSMCSIRVSDRRLLDAVFDAAGVLDTTMRLETARALDAVGKIGPEGVRLRLGPGRTDASGAFTPGLNLPDAAIDTLLAFLDIPPTADLDAGLDTIAALLPQAGGACAALRTILSLAQQGSSAGKIVLDPSIVRGMAYYTGMVFEITLDVPLLDAKGRPVSMGALGGGGRYDGLIRRFTGQDVPAVGGSIGFDRAWMALGLLGLVPPSTTPLVVVACLPGTEPGLSRTVARRLRANGWRAEACVGNTSSPGAQLKYADARGAAAAVLVGGTEWAEGLVCIKDLALGRALAGGATRSDWLARPAQVTVPVAELETALAGLLARPDLST